MMVDDGLGGMSRLNWLLFGTGAGAIMGFFAAALMLLYRWLERL